MMFDVNEYLKNTTEIGVTEILEIELTVSMVNHKTNRWQEGKA